MSARRLADSGITIPPNATYLDFPRTDGTSDTWPSNITRVVDHEGHVNYFEHVQLDDYQGVRWRVLVGEAVAKTLKMPVGPSYVLRSFPEGYRLYDHNKGPQSAPRHDLYLFGPIKKRFRSVHEFIPHAAWLLGDPNECGCKYCSKKTQREVTASMALSNIIRATPATQSPAPSRVKHARDKGKGRDPLSRLKEPRHRDTRVYAAVQRVAKPLKPSAGVLKQPMLVERNNDLRAIYSKTSMELRRWFREGEVVWCALDPPIPGPHGDGVAIQFWPGVIDEVKLKTQAIPRQANSNDASSSSQPDGPRASSSAMQLDPSPEDDGKSPTLESNDEPLPWTIRQSTRYKVQLLAVSHSYTIDDEQVLPYQAYMPTDELINLMATFPPEKLNFDKDTLSKFNPCPGPIPPTLFEAVPAYATALQIASTLSSFWCLTDDYELRYSIPASHPRPPLPSRALFPSQIPSSSQAPLLSQMPPPATFQQVLDAASEHNAHNSISTSRDPFYQNVSGLDPTMSQAEVQMASQHVLGAPPPPDNLVQTRFQGLWWGAERIWADDFIRLKIPRRTLAPNGSDNILPPSGPGKSVAANWIGKGRDPAELGAGTRGVFLRLDGIYAVDVPQENGSSTKEARVCGMLYELADEDWEEPSGTWQNPAPLFTPNSQSEGPSLAGPSTSNAESTSQQNAANGPTTNGDATSPYHMPYILPQAPIGYKFRPILTQGYEFVGAMGLISGRYYPRILSHPKIAPVVQDALSRPVEEGGVPGSDNLWALEGLSGGYFNSVDPRRYKRSRIVMMQDADREALDQLQRYAESKVEEANQKVNVDVAGIGNGNGNDEMDVDEMYA